MIHFLQHQPLALFGFVSLAGYYAGKGARKLHLPSLIGFMLLGLIMGPSLLNIFTEEGVKSYSFITETALGFVAFGIGSELSIKSLKSLGSGIVSIILAESFCAFFLVTGIVFLLTRSWPVALIFGAVAPASAPAGTVAVIQEYKAKGSLTKALYAVVGFDDGLAIIIFGFAAALAKVLLINQLHIEGMSAHFVESIMVPVKEIFFSLLVGTALGFVFGFIIRRLDSSRDSIILTIGTVLLASGIALQFHLSLILTNMIIGFILVNTRDEQRVHKVTEPLQNIMQLLFVFFFCLAGAHLKLGELPSLGFLGIVYILARSGGLIGGAWIGAQFGHVEEKIKKYIGLGILSQAGVAIGLSLIINHEFQELHHNSQIANAVRAFAETHPDLSRLAYDPAYIGAALITTVTATCIIFEIIGPILAKIALEKAGEINKA